MLVYKIKNKTTSKYYVGQTVKPVEDRWKKHLRDAKRLDTHFARAIKKYGKDDFIVEIICLAKDQDELNELEHYYIHKLDCLKNGYNETDSICKSGGNTFAGKTEKEMKLIKQKLRLTKLGSKNPMSKVTKMIDTFTKKEKIFSSASECAAYLSLNDDKKVRRRASGEVKSLLNNRYRFEYCVNESVSTIGDECSQVEGETSTSSKQETQEN